MARDEKTYHVEQDDSRGRIVECDSEGSEAKLQFEGYGIKLIYEDGRGEVLSSLKLPSRYFLKISYSALLGQRMMKEIGQLNSDVYRFKEKEIVWFSFGLLEKLLKKKISGLRKIEVLVNQ